MEPFSVDLPPVTELPPQTNTPSYLAHPATPVPTLPPYSSITNPAQSHPTYTEMITAAITALKEPNGSSKKAIAKYIETSFANLPGNHSTLLTHHLKRLKAAGQLVMVKHSYMLSRSVPFSSSAPPPPPPPPAPSVAAADANGVVANVVLPSPGTKRRPGRPPKPKVDAQPNGPHPVGAESVFVSLGLDDGPSPPSSAKRRPGRPPKQKTLPAAGLEAGGVNQNSTALAVAPVGQWDPNQFTAAPAAGEPLDPNGISVPAGNDRPKRKPGRPSRLGAGGSPGVARPAVGRPRGRPPRKAVAAAGGGNLVSVAAAGLLGKRRGRKPRAAGVKKPRKLTGKPIGRPKKNAAAPGAYAAGTQQRVAYEDLKSKLEHFNASFAGIQAAATEQLLAYGDLKSKVEHFQSRVLQTIGAVKPHLNHETALMALGALLELESLATADLTASPNVQEAPIN